MNVHNRAPHLHLNVYYVCEMPQYIEIDEVRALKQYIYHISLMTMNYVIIPTVRVNGTKWKKTEKK